MQAYPDRRPWLETDRPGERMAVSVPGPGVRVFSVTGSDRHCTELHETHTLCVLHAGQPGVGAEWRSGRGVGLASGSGDVMVMELGEVHRTTRVLGKAAYSVVQIAPRLVAQAAEQLGLKGARVRAANHSHPRLRAAVLAFAAAGAGESDPLTMECLLSDLLGTWLSLCGDERPRGEPVLHRGVRRARDALRERAARAGVSKSPRLDELAAISGLSTARFPHAFKQWLGISPYAYFNVGRLNCARSMLESGASATEVAASFGFADAAHFSRRFRAQFGLPPRAWSQLSRRKPG